MILNIILNQKKTYLLSDFKVLRTKLTPILSFEKPNVTSHIKITIKLKWRSIKYVVSVTSCYHRRSHRDHTEITERRASKC